MTASSPKVAPSRKRQLKNSGKRSLRRIFEFGQRFGLDILPRHFYSEIPGIRALREDGGWKDPRTMACIRGVELDAQFEFVESCCTPDLVAELRRRRIHHDAAERNGESGFGRVEADFLFAFIRNMRPEKVVQIGAGVSTSVILAAASESVGYQPEVICIDPYPTPWLREAAETHEICLIAKKAQSVPVELLTDLGSKGLLFIDSTHTVKPGSEVNRIILEILARLSGGSWIHFHDINFPYDYQRGLLDDSLFFWNETALLHAFLINNQQFTIRASLSMLHYADAARLQRSLPNYRPAFNDYGLRRSAGDFPSSIYMEASSA